MAEKFRRNCPIGPGVYANPHSTASRQKNTHGATSGSCLAESSVVDGPFVGSVMRAGDAIFVTSTVSTVATEPTSDGIIGTLACCLDVGEVFVLPRSTDVSGAKYVPPRNGCLIVRRTKSTSGLLSPEWFEITKF